MKRPDHNELRCHPGIYCRDPWHGKTEPIECAGQWVPVTSPGMTVVRVKDRNDCCHWRREASVIHRGVAV